ncbi:transglutaminase family protein [Patescibacteria group bacterium]
MLKKAILIIFILFFSISANTVQADAIYETNTNIEYKVFEDGNTAVSHTITLKNNTSYEYATNYLITLTNIKPNNLKAYESGSPIPFEVKQNEYNYTISLNFNEPLVGKGKTRTFLVTYEEESIAELSGEVWEISVPKIESQYGNTKVTISIPESFGDEAIISPKPTQKLNENERTLYTYDGSILRNSGVNAVFGVFQVYSIKLKYHLENNENKKKIFNIAIPPDTSTQKVFYSDIEPVPINIEVDEDGNWIASVELKPKEKREMIVTLHAQVFANPIKLLTPNPSSAIENLKAQKYWQVDDPNIRKIAQNLKNPENIYNFIVKTLTYDNKRVKPDTQRLGAYNALSSPGNAICTEFTDLFIALSRAAGVPAREINGYAHSDNPSLQPLSLFSDVLHSWPEYWDETDQNWKPVDPTWESTSGVDYFNKFDLKHIAFVIHGKSSSEPLPAGSYRSGNLTKDVFVELSKLPPQNKRSITIDHEVKNTINPLNKKLIINIKNNGPSAYYNLKPKIDYSDQAVSTNNITVLAPFTKHSISIDLPIGILATRSPEYVTVKIDSQSQTFYFAKARFSIQQLLLFLSFLLLILIYFGLRSKKIDLRFIKDKKLNIIGNVKKIKKTKI